MIRVEALPAGNGDCLWVEWTHRGTRRRMLIDGGNGSRTKLPPGLAERFARQPLSERRFDLVVCTHFDNDHIGGLLPLFAEPPEGFAADDVWFNGRRHLTAPDLLGPRQGDRLAELLRVSGQPWNAGTGGAAVAVPDEGPLPVLLLPGLRLTLLSPTWSGLRRLGAIWEDPDAMPGAEPDPDTGDDAFGAGDLLGDIGPGGEEGPEAGWGGGFGGPDIPWRELAGDAHYSRDTAPGNGSSIAFCAEDDEGARVLFGADAQAETLVASLRRLPGGAEPVRVDLCKVPHHGSSRNLSPELVDAIACRHWLISTDGGRTLGRGAHEAAFRPGEGEHPSLRAMARIIVRGGARPTLWFNHRVVSTERYAGALLAQELGFGAELPASGTSGITLLVGDGSVSRGM
ncbi:MBL fold metallo-hydrolase [Streptomyces polygonati]|uniref:MBL fold metallo-hydrolase n=1 Tax=Streptomyces polygonati TaxID=1617087 RepID=A0ABV8HSW5_9ACTN